MTEASNPFSLVHISADVDVGPTRISEGEGKEGGQEPLTKSEAREVSEKVLETGAPGLGGAEGVEVVVALDCLLEMEGGGGDSCQLTLDAPARRYIWGRLGGSIMGFSTMFRGVLRFFLGFSSSDLPVSLPSFCHLSGSEWLSDPPACDWCAIRRGQLPRRGR